MAGRRVASSFGEGVTPRAVLLPGSVRYRCLTRRRRPSMACYRKPHAGCRSGESLAALLSAKALFAVTPAKAGVHGRESMQLG